MKMYEINDQILAIMDKLEQQAIDNDGVVEDSTVDELKQLQMERTEKIEGIALYIKGQSALIDAIKAEESALKKRRQVIENRVARLKDFVSIELDGEKLETARCKISYRNSKAVRIADDVDLEELKCISNDLVSVKITASKTGLKKYIENGNTIDGVEIVNNRSTIIK